MLLEKIEKELYKLKPVIDDHTIYEFIITCKQQLVNYHNVIKDIEESTSLTLDAYISADEDEEEEYCLKDVTVKIGVSDTCSYKIIFSYVSDYEGYCQCKEGMEGYDLRYDCCGYKCDWDRPCVEIEKTETLGTKLYNGNQHSLWDTIDEYKNDLELKEQEERKAKRNKLEKEIDETKGRLDRLENMLKELIN